jgi:DNA-binding response OmpR family regulator
MAGVTGNTMREELRDFLLSGLDAVQTKPFSMQALLAFVPLLVTRGVRSAPGRKLRVKRMGDDLSAVTVEEVDAEEYFSTVG